MAISANELRIGNWINYKGEPIIVTMIGKYGIQSDNEGRTINAKFSTPDLTPIPLSPEILEKCGFRNVQGDYWMKDNELMLALDSVWWWTNSWEPDGEFGFSALATYKEIEHLHQLQNLYYALTGSELNINL